MDDKWKGHVPNVVSLEDMKPGEALTTLLYGSSGVGKTYFASTCGERVLFINIGNGIETLLSPSFQKQHPNVKKFKVVNINEIIVGKVFETALAFDKVDDTIEYMIKYHPNDFDHIYVDDMTTLGTMASNKAIELNKVDSKSQTLSKAQSAKHFPLLVVQDRGIEMDAIKWFLGTNVARCKEKGIHFTCVAHERSIYNPPKKIGDEPVLRRIQPHFTGKDNFAPDVVPGFFDNVWRMTVTGASDQAKRSIKTSRDAMVIAKTRHGHVLKDKEENPNFLDLLTRIKADK